MSILYWVMDGTNIDPYLPPIPIPSVSKSLLPAGIQSKEKHVFNYFLWIYKESEKSIVKH